MRKALQALGGVSAAQVEIGSAQVSYDPSRVQVEQIREAVEEAGYEVAAAV